MYITNNTRSLFTYWRSGVGDAPLAEDRVCYLIVGTPVPGCPLEVLIHRVLPIGLVGAAVGRPPNNLLANY